MAGGWTYKRLFLVHFAFYSIRNIGFCLRSQLLNVLFKTNAFFKSLILLFHALFYLKSFLFGFTSLSWLYTCSYCQVSIVCSMQCSVFMFIQGILRIKTMGVARTEKNRFPFTVVLFNQNLVFSYFTVYYGNVLYIIYCAYLNCNVDVDVDVDVDMVCWYCIEMWI